MSAAVAVLCCSRPPTPSRSACSAAAPLPHCQLAALAVRPPLVAPPPGLQLLPPTVTASAPGFATLLLAGSNMRSPRSRHRRRPVPAYGHRACSTPASGCTHLQHRFVAGSSTGSCWLQHAVSGGVSHRHRAGDVRSTGCCRFQHRRLPSLAPAAAGCSTWHQVALLLQHRRWPVPAPALADHSTGGGPFSQPRWPVPAPVTSRRTWVHPWSLPVADRGHCDRSVRSPPL